MCINLIEEMYTIKHNTSYYMENAARVKKIPGEIERENKVSKGKY